MNHFPLPKARFFSKLLEHVDRDGGRYYSYLDPDDGHGLAIYVDKNGILGSDIRAQGDASVLGSGRDMFLSAMQRLRADGVNVSAIRGLWLPGSRKDSVNWVEFHENLPTMSPQAAAANTWTGRIAADLGYTQVSQPRVGGTVEVYFTKPR
jgi:hypothetical protein